MTNESIVIAGVGGQGTLLASKIIGGAAIKSEYDVKVSEVHGMSQRGGSVVTFVRYGGEPVHSPVVSAGEADTVLSFELLEAYRALTFLKQGGRVITNTQALPPMPVLSGKEAYPSGIEERLRALNLRFEALDALTLATEAGSARAVNMVLIGKYAAATGIHEEIWRSVIADTVKPATLEINLNAFKAGYQYGK